MRDLFRAELRRLGVLAALYTAGHVGVLLFLTRVVDLLQQPTLVYKVGAAIHVAWGLGLGAWQLRAHSRPNAWLYLLHRPLAPARIAAAVLGAGGAAVLAAVVVPMLLALAAQRGLTVRVVDVRHLLLPVAGGLLALAGYLVGALLAIAPLRRAPAPLVILTWLASSYAAGASVLAVLALGVTALAALAVLAFRPDASEVPRHPLALIALLAPMTAAWAVVLPVATLIFQLGWIATGDHPNNRVTPLPGGHVEAVRGEGREVLLRGLAGLAGEEAAVLRGQVELSEVARVGPAFETVAERGDLTNPLPPEFDDEDGVRWVFSHDAMRFVGMDAAHLTHKGRLAGNGGFTAPPRVLDRGMILDGGTVRSLDAPAHHLRIRAQLPGGDVLADRPVLLGQALVALGARQLVVFDARDLERATAPLPVIEQIALPTPIGDLSRVDLIELLDGYLVSFVSGNGYTNGGRLGQQWIFRVERGASRLLAKRELRVDYPELSRMRARWTAPLVGLVSQRAVTLGAGDDTLTATPDEPMSGALWGLAVGLSALAAAWTSRRARRLGRSQGWAVAALALGWPLALAFALVVPAPWRASSEKRTLGAWRATRRHAAQAGSEAAVREGSGA